MQIPPQIRNPFPLNNFPREKGKEQEGSVARFQKKDSQTPKNLSIESISRQIPNKQLYSS